MRRPAVLTINLSADEKARIAYAASSVRRPMAQWARLVLLDALKLEAAHDRR